MRFYGSIQKVDDEKRMVYGYASTEAVDTSGETILKSAVDDALEDYMKFANIREMHQLSAVGTTEEAEVDDKGLYIGAHVVDDKAWAKVQAGVYKGFSVGGKTLARDPKDKKIITKIGLYEISLVDRPNNPETTFDVWKAAHTDGEDMATNAETAEVAEIAEADEYFAKRDFDSKERKKDAKSGVAMKDGSFPIENAKDLKNAIRLAGNAKDPAAAKAHIKARAKALGLESEIPDTWKAIETGDIAKAGDGLSAEAEAAPETAAESDVAAKVLGTVKEMAGKVEALAAKLAPADLEKGMYAVGRFAEMLQSISYLAASGQYEADSEGDGSKIPATLREWLKAGAAIFKDMAKEEVDELVASANVKKAIEAESLAKVATEAAGGKIADAAAAALAKAEAATSALAKAASEHEAALAKVLAERDATLKAVANHLEPLAKRIAELEAMPMPSKTAGPGAVYAVSKEADAAGGVVEKTADPSDPVELAKAWGSLSEEERTLASIKATRQFPQRVTFRG